MHPLRLPRDFLLSPLASRPEIPTHFATSAFIDTARARALGRHSGLGRKKVATAGLGSAVPALRGELPSSRPGERVARGGWQSRSADLRGEPLA